MDKRWYDKDPTLSLAVSLIKNESAARQSACAQMIIDTAVNSGVKKSNTLIDAFNYVLRWYDADEKITDAFDYLKAAAEDIRKEIAIEIIEYLQKAEV
jgi:hypothetical protein